MNDTTLPAQRYFELIDSDTERLLEMGERGLTEPVPSCPGWDVAEVVWHTAGVYEHKVRVMADNAWPDPWPPPDFDGRPELDFLRGAKDDLFAEFARHDIEEPTTTFGADSTIGFWARRMALEAAVHRYDAEPHTGGRRPRRRRYRRGAAGDARRPVVGRAGRHRASCRRCGHGRGGRANMVV
jgi:hypothetical protein